MCESVTNKSKFPQLPNCVGNHNTVWKLRKFTIVCAFLTKKIVKAIFSQNVLGTQLRDDFTKYYFGEKNFVKSIYHETLYLVLYRYTYVLCILVNDNESEKHLGIRDRS